MRREMRESLLREHMAETMSERAERGDMLVEKWGKRRNLGEGIEKIYDKSPERARGLCFVLENQAKYLRKLTETQISNAFQTTPENVLRVVRLGYPNSVRGQIFLDWQMDTARDSIYYLSPIYASTKRGATAGNVTHESSSWRYGSEIEEDTCATADNQNYTGSGGGGAVPNPPLRPYTVLVFENDIPVGRDDGAGNIVNLASGGPITEGAGSVINYTSGVLAIAFTAVDATRTTTVQYNFDSEESTQYPDIGDVELTLRAYQFRCYPWPLGIGWSKMTELLLGTTLDIDAEEALLKGAGDELKKALDFHACTLGYKYAKGNATIQFDADFASAGADSEMAHAQSITRSVDDAGDLIFNAYNRGGVTVMYGGSKAVNFMKLHSRFSDTGRQPKIGVHKVGEIDGISLFKTPNSIVPTDEIVCVWKNENVPEDVSIAFGTLIPLYRTQTLEYKQAYKETGLFHFGDWKALNSAYLVRLELLNL